MGYTENRKQYLADKETVLKIINDQTIHGKNMSPTDEVIDHAKNEGIDADAILYQLKKEGSTCEPKEGYIRALI